MAAFGPLPPNHRTMVRRKTHWTPPPAPQGMEGEGSLLVRLDVEGAKVPELTRAGDAGLDLYVSGRTVIRPGEFADVPCGISMQLPVDMWARITGRSSTLRKRGLLVSEAVIDNGYVGPIYTGVWNLGRAVAIVEPGERIAQLVLHRIVRVPITEVDGILWSRDGRGTGGFGSSGA